MAEITFQKATIDNIGTFIELEKKVAHMKVYSPTLDEDEAKKEIEENEVFFIKKDGVIVGTTQYQIQSSEVAYLGGLVIDPQFQGQGIARKAIEFRLDKLKDFKRIWTVTHPDNIKIIKLYQSYGFVIEAKKENYYGDGESRVVLSREL